MSGETRESVSGWTTDTIKTHFDDLRDTDNGNTEKRFDLAEKAVAAALAAAEKASDKADKATEKRFDGVNEFRQTLSDQAATLLSRVEYTAAHRPLIDRIDALAGRIERIEGRGSGITDASKVVYAVAVIFVALAAAFIGHNFK